MKNYKTAAFVNFWPDNLEAEDLTKIGIMHIDSGNNNNKINGVPHNVKWIVEDPDYQLGTPQIVDLQNGR